MANPCMLYGIPCEAGTEFDCRCRKTFFASSKTSGTATSVNTAQDKPRPDTACQRIMWHLRQMCLRDIVPVPYMHCFQSNHGYYGIMWDDGSAFCRG